MYKDILDKIKVTLQKESKFNENKFNKGLERYGHIDYQKFSDNEIFWIIIYVTFYSGMNAGTVTKRLPVIKKYLYDFKKVKDYTEKEINLILSDSDTIHHKNKIAACINNANIFYEIIKKYGSFAKYLESFGNLNNEETIKKLEGDLKSKFKYFGDRTSNHFLTDLGINVLKPDRVICRIFFRLGLIDSVDNLEQAIQVGRKISKETGLPIRIVDILLVSYGQVNGNYEDFGVNEGVCLEENPHCKICELKNYCRYFNNKTGV